MARVGPIWMLRGAALGLAGCAATPAPASCSAAELECHCVVATQLFFGMSRPDGSVLSEAEWQAFLADVATPLFPDGFTVLSGEGQWRDPRPVGSAASRRAFW